MTQSQINWTRSRDRLTAALEALGFHAELGELMARQLGSPKAIDRMTSYLYQAKPHTEEMVVDEMLALCSEIDAWRERKASQEASAKYNAMLYYGEIGHGDDDEES